MSSRCVLLSFAIFAIASVSFTVAQVTKYSAFVDQSEVGMSFGISLMDEKLTEIKKIELKPGANTTLAAIETIGRNDPNYKTIVVLLDESAGGRCDACRTTVENLVITMLKLVKKQGREALSKQLAGTGSPNYKISIDPADATRAVNKMCIDKKFTHYAPHIMKGCVEFLSLNGTAMVSKLNAALQGENYVGLMNELCVDMLGVCMTRPEPPKKLNKCRGCAEIISLFDYKLRRSNNVAVDDHTDTMSLTKKKKKDMSFMSKAYLQGRIDFLCATDSIQSSLLVSERFAQNLNEACDEFVSDYEEDLVRVFTKKKHMDFAAGQEFCVDVTESCSGISEYEEASSLVMSKNDVVAFGPLEISITPQQDKASSVPRLSPAEKAAQIARKELKAQATQPKGQPKKNSPPVEEPRARKQEMTQEEEIEALQDFIDEMEAQGKFSTEQSEALLRMAFNADKPLLRCYRINKNKGNAKMVARMKLILPADLPKATKNTESPGFAGLSEEKMAALSQKMKEIHSGGSSLKDVDKLGDTLGQLKEQMQGQGMDTATLEKLDSMLKSTKKMSESMKTQAQGDTLTAADQAADATLEAQKARGTPPVPEMTEL